MSLPTLPRIISSDVFHNLQNSDSPKDAQASEGDSDEEDKPKELKGTFQSEDDIPQPANMEGARAAARVLILLLPFVLELKYMCLCRIPRRGHRNRSNLVDRINNQPPKNTYILFIFLSARET
jgi:hypothetical protein